MFENIGGSEILVILFIVFIFFGPKKLPELGKNIGKGLREFRNAMSSVQKDLENSTKDVTDEIKNSTRAGSKWQYKRQCCGARTQKQRGPALTDCTATEMMQPSPG